MTFKDDIIKKIKEDFGEKADNAIAVIINTTGKVDYLKTDRLIRCLVYLSKGDIPQLNEYIEMAIIDSRDVIYWAEYEAVPVNESLKRQRDFNQNFNQTLHR
jgi:hypothetical protein